MSSVEAAPNFAKGSILIDQRNRGFDRTSEKVAWSFAKRQAEMPTCRSGTKPIDQKWLELHIDEISPIQVHCSLFGQS